MIEMTKQDYTPYQQRIIARYYDNLDTIALTKLQELVGELYLADTDKKRERLWKRVEQAIARLNVPPSIAEHILASRDVEILAKNLQDWLKNARPKT